MSNHLRKGLGFRVAVQTPNSIIIHLRTLRDGTLVYKTVSVLLARVD
jgi:hypothetical protein